MKYKSVVIFLLIIASGLFWGWLRKSLKTSGMLLTWSYLLPDILMYIACYLSGYLIVALCLRYFRKDLNFYLTYIWSILGTSLIGSFFFGVYNLIQNINRDWWYISVHQNDLFSRHIYFSIEFFIVGVIQFSIFGFIFLVPVVIFNGLCRRSKTRLT